MSEIRFYHLERQDLDQALPGLLAKALENGHRIVVKAANENDIKRLNDNLWTYDPNSFMPHGTAKEGHAEHQPVWLTTKDENPNGADVLVLINAAETDMLDQFALCCEMFDGRNEDILAQARERWKTLKDSEHDLTYWQQGQSGWEKKI